MTNFQSNLNMRDIVLTPEEIREVSSISRRKLKEVPVYTVLSDEIKTIIQTNVLIVATTDRVKRAEHKTDIIIANLADAIKLVLQDARAGSALVN